MAFASGKRLAGAGEKILVLSAKKFNDFANLHDSSK